MSQPADVTAPRTWSFVLTFFVMVVVLEDVSRQITPNPFAMCAIVPAIGILVLNYLCLLGTRPRERLDGGVKSAQRLWRWLVLPVAAAVAISALGTHWPMSARFAFSQDAFEQQLMQFRERGEVRAGPQRLGLYWVSSILRMGDRVEFFVGHSISDPVAFSYDARPRHTRGIGWHIVGNWYAIET